MNKKSLKVVIEIENDKCLKEVKGYYTWLNDLKVFIYKDVLKREWYIIDLDTGLSITMGFTMVQAKDNAINKLDNFKKFKETEKYKICRFEYQYLLKKEREKEI